MRSRHRDLPRPSRLAPAAEFQASARRGALSVRHGLRSLERYRKAPRRRALARHLRVSLSARSAGLARRSEAPRDRGAVECAEGLLRALVQDARRAVRRRLSGLRQRRRIRRAHRAMPASMARQARFCRARDLGPRPLRLAVSRPRGVRGRPGAGVLRPRSRDPAGERAPARSQDAVPPDPRRERRGEVVAVARRADAETHSARRDSRSRSVPARRDDAGARPVRRARRCAARASGARGRTRQRPLRRQGCVDRGAEGRPGDGGWPDRRGARQGGGGAARGRAFR